MGRCGGQAGHAPGVCGEEILSIPVAERGVSARESAECTEARGPVDHFASTGMPRISAGLDPARRC